jgi:hypothetical protein
MTSVGVTPSKYAWHELAAWRKGPKNQRTGQFMPLARGVGTRFALVFTNVFAAEGTRLVPPLAFTRDRCCGSRSRSGTSKTIVYTRLGLPTLEEASMAVIKIRDLADSVELDRQAMHTIVGGARDGVRPLFRIRPASATNRVVDYPGVPVKDVPATQAGPFTRRFVSKK